MPDPFSGIASFPILEMDYFGLTENQLNKLPPKQRLEEMIKIIKHSDDESQRWDSICLCGELYHVLDRVDHDLSNVDSLQMKTHIKDLFRWVLKNEKNGVVLHEVCYHIAARNIRELIPDLVTCGVCSDSILGRHEAIESLGLMNAQEVMDEIKHALDDPVRDVRETAQFVLKRLRRYRNEAYEGLQII